MRRTIDIGNLFKVDRGCARIAYRLYAVEGSTCLSFFEREGCAGASGSLSA